jgi:hypothetical protein
LDDFAAITKRGAEEKRCAGNGELGGRGDRQFARTGPARAVKISSAIGKLGVDAGEGFYTYPDPAYLRSGFLA